jgi:glycosyltransferase involved in cell wall biosynthesis
MRLALVAHPRHPVRPPFAGGMEAHAWHLTRALVARGHDVTLFASGDSDPDLPLVPIVDTHLERDTPQGDAQAMRRMTLRTDAAHARLCRRLLEGGFDAVHNNGLHRYLPRLAVAEGLPMVTSLHVPPFDALRRSVRESAAPWARFAAPSAALRALWWEAPPPEAAVVPNGIDLAAWPFRARGDGSAVWAGRIAPNKGTHLALDAAREAGVALTLYGVVEDRAYWEAEVGPRLGPRARYGGHLPGPRLAEAMGRASAFLFTPCWEEPFGLAAIEAMACGLPVAALERGAAREVIGPRAGRFARAEDGTPALAAALRAALEVPRAVPREEVARRFSLGAMVAGYEALYAAVRAARPTRPPARAFPALELAVAPPAAAVPA